MEYVEGELLSARVAKGPLAVREVVDDRPAGRRRARRGARARHRAPRHQEREPDADRARPRQGARLRAGEVRRPEGAEAARLTQPQMTIAGMVVGTVSYMAPEQALGRPVDHRADLFSLGVVLFELVDRPDCRSSARRRTEIIDHILHEMPPPPSRLCAGGARRRSMPSSRARSRSRRRSATSPRATCIRISATSPSELDTRAAGHDQPSRCRPSAGVDRRRALGRGDDVREHHARAGRRLDRYGHRRDRQLGPQEHPRPDDHRPRARLRRAAQSQLGRPSRRVARDRHRPPSRRHLGRRRRIPAASASSSASPPTSSTSATGEVRRTVKVDGRIGDIFALQDKIVFELSQGLNLALRGTEIADIEQRETQSVEAYESYARGMMNLRLATRDSIERAIAAFEDAIASRSGVRDRVGGARRRLRAQGLVSLSIQRSGRARAIEIERRARRDRSRARRRAHVARHRAPQPRAGRRRHRGDPRGDPARARERTGPSGAGPRVLGRQGRLRGRDSRLRARRSSSTPRRATRICSSGCCSRGKASIERSRGVCRRAVELQDQYISGNAGLQVVGAQRAARLRATTCRAATTRRFANTSAASRSSASSDHALKERTSIEITMKIGAAYHRMGRAEEAARYFDRALKVFDARVAKGADDPYTRYYIACLLALARRRRARARRARARLRDASRR